MTVCVFENVTKSYRAVILSILGCFHYCNKKSLKLGNLQKRKEAYLSKDLVADYLHSRGVGSSERSSHEGPNIIMASRENQNC